MSNILPATTRWYNCFFEPFFTDYLLENDFVKNKSAVRCSFSYFLGLFPKSIFHLFTTDVVTSSACFRAPAGTSGGRFKGKLRKV
jgi:hypothetical protein